MRLVVLHLRNGQNLNRVQPLDGLDLPPDLLVHLGRGRGGGGRGGVGGGRGGGGRGNPQILGGVVPRGVREGELALVVGPQALRAFGRLHGDVAGIQRAAAVGHHPRHQRARGGRRRREAPRGGTARRKGGGGRGAVVVARSQLSLLRLVFTATMHHIMDLAKGAASMQPGGPSRERSRSIGRGYQP